MILFATKLKMLGADLHPFQEWRSDTSRGHH